MRKIIYLLSILVMLGCSSLRAEQPDPFENCPLLKHEILAVYRIDEKRFWAWHPLWSDDGRADVMVLYYFSKDSEDFYELQRCWLREVPKKTLK